MDSIFASLPRVKSDIEALEDLVLDSDLDRLEALTGGFNIFESIGAVRREVRHSDFLSYLLKPNESHGLFDTFLKVLLFSVVKNNRSTTDLSPLDIDILDLSTVEVRREWENIDILLVSDKEKFVCAIENKIDSSEHSNQLNRYETTIKRSFPKYTKLFVYLTLDGESPENDQNWLPYSYSDMYKLVKEILSESEGRIGEDIFILIKHYADMINRHFMNDNEIAELCKKLYQKHQKALDIIFEHKPDLLSEINKYITEFIAKHNSKDVILDHCIKTYVRFARKPWDNIKGQLTGDGQWTKSNRVLLFEITNNLDGVNLKLVIGPGDKNFREEIFSASLGDKKLFTGRLRSLTGKWTQLYKKKIVTKEQMEYDLDTIQKLIQQELNNFFYYGEYEKLSEFFDEKYGLDSSNK